MTEKIPGQPLRNKLRILRLLGADLQRRLMTQDEKWNTFGDEQWGSRTGRSATAATAVLVKHFTCLLMRLAKIDGATFDNDTNDAKACFDRIVPALTNNNNRILF
jgi:hypothetical protein